MSTLRNFTTNPTELTLLDEYELKKTLQEDLTTSKKPPKSNFWLIWQVRTVS